MQKLGLSYDWCTSSRRPTRATRSGRSGIFGVLYERRARVSRRGASPNFCPGARHRARERRGPRRQVHQRPTRDPIRAPADGRSGCSRSPSTPNRRKSGSRRPRLAARRGTYKAQRDWIGKSIGANDPAQGRRSTARHLSGAADAGQARDGERGPTSRSAVFTTRPARCSAAQRRARARASALRRCDHRRLRSTASGRRLSRRGSASAARRSHTTEAADAPKASVFDRRVRGQSLINAAHVPIWIADYVLATAYGTRRGVRVPRRASATSRICRRSSTCRSSWSSRAAIPTSARTSATASTSTATSSTAC